MNCLDSRRSLLAAPRARTPELEGHLARCSDCARLVARLAELDRRVADAALVAVPDALAERVLRVRRRRPWSLYAAAAAVLVGSAVAMIGPRLWEAAPFYTPLTAVGPTHPGVTAIAVVVEQQPANVDDARSIDVAAMEDGLRRLGLTLKKDGVKVDYAGKCYMPDADCDHLVLDTRDGHVSVILVPDYPVGSRSLVVDRRMTALVNPAGSGGYIVVAGSSKVAKRAGRLFVKG